MKYILWTISTIRDIFDYNEHDLLNGRVIDRISKELLIIEEKETKYDKDDVELFFNDIISFDNITTLPNSKKAIEKYGE